MMNETRGERLGVKDKKENVGKENEKERKMQRYIEPQHIQRTSSPIYNADVL